MLARELLIPCVSDFPFMLSFSPSCRSFNVSFSTSQACWLPWQHRPSFPLQPGKGGAAVCGRETYHDQEYLSRSHGSEHTSPPGNPRICLCTPVSILNGEEEGNQEAKGLLVWLWWCQCQNVRLMVSERVAIHRVGIWGVCSLLFYLCLTADLSQKYWP